MGHAAICCQMLPVKNWAKKTWVWAFSSLTERIQTEKMDSHKPWQPQNNNWQWHFTAVTALTRRTTSATILWSNVSLFLSPLHDTARLVNNLIYGGLSIASTGRLWLAEDNWKDVWLLIVTTRVFTHKYTHELIAYCIQIISWLIKLDIVYFDFFFLNRKRAGTLLFCFQATPHTRLLVQATAFLSELLFSYWVDRVMWQTLKHSIFSHWQSIFSICCLLEVHNICCWSLASRHQNSPDSSVSALQKRRFGGIPAGGEAGPWKQNV